MKIKKKRSSENKLHAIKRMPQKLNAFEIHVNRRKFDVVGMKLKTEKGLPGISRSRAIKKRKATLMQEYKTKNIKNTFMDRRIGEKNNAMTMEDKIMARYTAEKMKVHSKKSLFNLGDSEELTHRGESLTEIEKYDDPKSDDDDDDDDGKLDADFVREAHFGGGILKKVDGGPKSRKDIIDELIAESKKKKAEKQKLREETLDLTQKLDSDWKELLPLVTRANKGDVGMDIKKDAKSASYDILSKQLKFEKRGMPMDRLKSEEEIAKEEKKRLEAMEQERIDRMLGDNKKKPPKHRSADDFDDGFNLNNDSDFILNYNKDGLLNVDVDITDNTKDLYKPENNQHENSYDDDDDIDDDDDDDGEHEEDENDKESDAETSESVNLSDLKESDESDAELPESASKSQKEKKLIKATREGNDKKSESQRQEGNQSHSKEIEVLPYTFEIPNDYESFEKLMANRNPFMQSVIIERMIKCNHPCLDSLNKAKLDILFTFLLQHLEDSATSETVSENNCFKVLESISPLMYDLVQWNPESCGAAIITVIKEKYQNFLKHKKTYPGLNTLIFLKLVNLLFSTSDYRHKIATPAMLFMEQVLSLSAVVSSVDVSTGLFISTLMLEFCSFSKRVVPEVFNFIKGVLRMSHEKDFYIHPLLPFKLSDMDKFNLIVSDKSRPIAVQKMNISDLTVNVKSDEYKIKSVLLSLQILSELCDRAQGTPEMILILETFVPLLNEQNYNISLRGYIQDVLKKIMSIKEKPLDRLVPEKKRPKPLRLYEPRVEQIYSLKKHPPMNREKQERAKLQHRYKREMKGALREIRKDNSFLAKLKFGDIRKSDMERQRKVREIMSSVSEQTGQFRKLKRKK